jgi:transcriptional regulator with XRE-family HTH domain
MDNVEKYRKINFNHLGRGLGALRRIKGHTLEDLAFYTRKDLAYLSRLENGKSSPKMETLSDILSFYEMTLKQFYDNLDDFI